MKVLALNPYAGGSHADFLGQWMNQSLHDWTLLSLPPRHFKWRIRQAAIGFARQARQLIHEGQRFDLIWTTSLLDAAELRGLLPEALRNLPLVVYFHENQFEYPVRSVDERDVHFGLINWASALAADEVWFNSDYNRRSFLRGAETLLKKMPDERELGSLSEIRTKARVEPPGLALDPQPARKSPGPLRLLWVGRWEHDKRPDVFFEALRRLKDWHISFRVSLLGQSFRVWPQAFESAQSEFSEQIEHFGYEPDKTRYWEILRLADAVVSTADHEFFGLALLEAVSAGCVPVVPDRLVYPELYGHRATYFGDASSLAERLQGLSQMKQLGRLAGYFRELGVENLVRQHAIEKRTVELDAALLRATQGFARSTSREP